VSSTNTFTDGRHNIISRTILAKTGHLQHKSSEKQQSGNHLQQDLHGLCSNVSLSTAALLYTKLASVVIFLVICGAQGKNERETPYIKYDAVLSDYQQT
jgi:hypothetical protein